MSVLSDIVDFARVRALAPTREAAIKSYYPYIEGQGPLFGGYDAGTIGRNRDLTQTPEGAALAYRMVWPAYRSVLLRSRMISATRWRLVNDAGEEVDSSDEVIHKHPIGQAIARSYTYHNEDIFFLWEFSRSLYGEVYFRLMPNRYDKPAAIRWLNTIGVSHPSMGGPLYYSAGSRSMVVPPDQAVRDREIDPLDDEAGWSPMYVAMLEINTELNASKYWVSYFANDARPGGLIQPTERTPSWRDEIVSQIQRMWRQTFKGGDGAGRVAILPERIDYLPFDPPDLSKQIPLKDDAVKSIFNAFGVSRAMSGDSESSSYQNNNSATRRALYETVIQPEALDIAAAFNAHVVPRFVEAGAPPVRFEFDLSEFEGVTEVDKLKADMVAQKVASGLMPLDKAAEELGEEPDEALTGLYMVEGIPVPREELRGLWRSRYALPAPIEEASRDEDEPIRSDGSPTLAKHAHGEQCNHTHHKAGEPIKSTPDKYSHINFDVPDGVREAARRALEWLEEGLAGDGFTDTGRARASDLASSGYTPSPEIVRRMDNYFSRHQNDSDAEGFNGGEDGYPSPGRVAWDAWGGDAGAAYARRVTSQMDAADEEAAKSARRWVDDVAGELAAWQTYAKKRGAIKALEFDPDHTRGYFADMVRELLGQGEPIKAVFDHVFDALRIKAIDNTRARWIDELTALLSRAERGTITQTQFGGDMRNLLTDYGFRAYADGLTDGGVRGGLEAIDEDDRRAILNIIREQRRYITNLGEALYADGRVTEAEIALKPELWFRKTIQPFYYAGLESAAANQVFEFGGQDGLESCDDCQRLKGQRHKMSDWVDRRLRPGIDTESFECGGWQCEHRLFPVKAAPRGNWLSDPPGKWQ